MNFTWKEFYDQAERLYGEGLSTSSNHVQEGYMRSAISRAYYSCYLTIRANFLSRKVSIPRVKDAGDHEALVQHLLSNENNEIIGQTLQHLKTWRRKADYDLIIKIDWVKKTEEVLSEAKSILENIKTLHIRS